jgi:hypothetical protein
MHRELGRIYTDGNVVVVQLALQGTHDGPLQLPFGELPATGKLNSAIQPSRSLRSATWYALRTADT